MWKLFICIFVVAAVMSILIPTYGDEAWLRRKRLERRVLEKTKEEENVSS